MHDFSLSTRTVEVGEPLSSRRGLHGEMLSQEQNKSCLKSKTKNVFYIGMCPLLFYQLVPVPEVREERERREIREAEGVHGSPSNTFISLLLSIQEQRAHAYSTEH